MTNKNIKDQSFNNRSAWIFGGSEGIGLAIAEALALSGTDVVIVSRSEQKLQAAVNKIQQQLTSTGGEQSSIGTINSRVLDICDYPATQQLVGELMQQQAAPDWVFNCAGFCRPGYFDQLETDHFQQMIQLNLMGTVHVCKAVEPFLRKAGKGHIINTASIAGFIPLFGYTGYSASKFAVKGFSRALRIELKPFNIKVSLLCPPNTKTPGLETENIHKPDAVLKTEEKLVPMEPEAVAQIVLKKLHSNPWLIIPGADGWLAYWVNRLSTRLMNWIVRRPVESVKDSVG